jgi:hypothetical protein
MMNMFTLPLRLAHICLLLCALLLTGCPGSKEPTPNTQNPDTQKPDDKDPDDKIPSWGKQPALPAVAGEDAFALAAADGHVNVMKNFMPRMPSFPKLKLTPGKMTGFVADLSGKPLKGAFVGVRSTVVGGSYSSADDETDENGFYEILVPYGAAEVWAAGYSIDYGSGKAAIGLYPEDGDMESFQSDKGLVKNFVLLSYGLADEDERAEKPWSSAGYFGGALYLSYNMGDPGDIWASVGSLPYNSEIEIKLTPKGEMLYGETKTFTITKNVGDASFGSCTINNLPVGLYTMSAKMKDGRPLKLRQIGPYVSSYPHHGLKPKEAVGSVEVWFTPMGVKASFGTPNYGSWRPVDIKVELP